MADARTACRSSFRGARAPAAPPSAPSVPYPAPPRRATRPSLLGVPLPDPYDPEEWLRLRRFGPSAGATAASLPFTYPFALASQGIPLATSALASALATGGGGLSRSPHGGIPGIRGAQGDKPYWDVRDVIGDVGDKLLPPPPAGGFTVEQAEGRAPLGDSPPSVAQPSVAPTVETTPPRTIAPPPTPAVPEAPNLIGTLDEEVERLRPAYQAATYRPPMRAIRLPNGRMLFTNQEGYGGQEMSTAEGGKVVRAQDRVEASREMPARAAIKGMLQASIRDASLRETAPEAESGDILPRGRQVEGEAYDMRPGVSMIEGTPEIQRRIALEDAMGALSLAEANQRTEMAQLPAGARLAAEDPEIRRMTWVIRNIQPKIDAIQQQASAEITQIKATIPDQREQQKMIDEVEASAAERINPLISVISMASRQRLPQT